GPDARPGPGAPGPSPVKPVRPEGGGVPQRRRPEGGRALRNGDAADTDPQPRRAGPDGPGLRGPLDRVAAAAGQRGRVLGLTHTGPARVWLDGRLIIDGSVGGRNPVGGETS